MKISPQLRAIPSLPLAMFGIVPSLLLLLMTSIDTRWDTSDPVYGLAFFIGLLLIMAGMILLVTTTYLFSTGGKRKLTPWLGGSAK